MRDKTHMIISIDIEKAFDNIQPPFTIKKTLKKTGIKEMYHNTIMAIYDKPTVNNIFSSESGKLFQINQEHDRDAYSHHFNSS